jgi:hypothetical protein
LQSVAEKRVDLCLIGHDCFRSGPNSPAMHDGFPISATFGRQAGPQDLDLQNAAKGNAMKAPRIIRALGLALGLSACGGNDLASRSAPLATSVVAVGTSNGPRQVFLVSQYNVREIRIDVPRDLKVSEANMFYPVADIVWRGEPRGDRHMQVHSIFTDAFGMGTAQMKQGPDVMVDIKVKRFHGVTEKTRYTVGGVFNMVYDLTVRDAKTGAILEGPREVAVATRAAGGSVAIEEEQAGRTQRVVVMEALRESARRELSRQMEDILTSRAAPSIALTPGRLLAQSPLPL